MKHGDRVFLAHGPKVLAGMIVLAPPNQESLVVMFDGMITGHVGSMPLRLDDGVYRSLIDGAAVLVTAEPPPPLTPSEYRCEACAGVFARPRDDDEAWADAEARWPGLKREEAALICEDCKARLVAKGMPARASDVRDG
jgi:hypothetical protein